MKHHCVLYYFVTDALADFRLFLWSWYADEKQMIELIEADARAQLRAAKRENDPTIDDGFGSVWHKRCARCGKLTMEVVRPGKAQCSKCG